MKKMEQVGVFRQNARAWFLIAGAPLRIIYYNNC